MNTLDDQISELSKALALVDRDAKQLRVEVGTLEMARHAQEMFRDTQGKALVDADLPNTAEAHQRKVASKHLPGTPRNRRNILPNPLVRPEGLQDFYDELNAKISEATKGLHAFRDITAEVCTTERVTREMEDHYELQLRQLEAMQNKAQWRPGSGTTRACPIVLCDELSKTKKRLLDLADDQATLDQELQRQLTSIAALTKEAEQTTELQEALRAVRTDVAVLELEDRSVQDEIDGLRRLLKRKDKLYDQTNVRSAGTTVRETRDLEATKRVTQTKLLGHKDQVRTNDAAIRHRAIVISRLQQRLEAIGDALQGTDTNHAERVDINVVESLRRETDILAKEAAENALRLGSLDADLEQLEGRKQILEKASRQIEEDEKRKRQEHERFTKLVATQRDAQRAGANAFLAQLEDAVEAIREESGSQRRSRSGQGLSCPPTASSTDGNPEVAV